MLIVRCPQCGKPVEWEASPFRPFCSERCKLIDLGKWAAEDYRIAGEPIPSSPQDRPSESETAPDHDASVT
jgi:endogenous inhibitor of DNA gyrase (YacG/DUF329 family)